MKLFQKKISRHLRWFRGVVAYKPKRNQMRQPGPLSASIQTVNRCNAACIMCPYSLARHSGKLREMDDHLFLRILRELELAGTVNAVFLMLQNEPLLDPRLHKRLKLTKKILKDLKRISFVTNGSLLNQRRIKQLYQSGLKDISVSIDSCDQETFNKIRRGLNFSLVVKNTEELLKFENRMKVTVKFLRQRANHGEEKSFAQYWRSRGADVSFDVMTNRAGALDQYERLKSQHPSVARRILHNILNRLIPVCPLPFSSLYILWDGRVILCSHDWEHRDIIGDISRQNLKQIWNGERMNHYRKLLWEHRTGENPICKDCSLADRFWNH